MLAPRTPRPAAEPKAQSPPKVQSQSKSKSQSAPLSAAPAERRQQGAASLADRLQQVTASAGVPLDPDIRRLAEPGFRHDFGAVRIHSDAPAAQLATDLDARAFATGSHLVFSPGAYAPHHPQGRRLLFHELAHAVQQQRSAAAPLNLDLSLPGQPCELAAESASAAALDGWRALPPLAPTPRHIARDTTTGAPATKPEDPHKGEVVSKIVIDLARERVGFLTGTSSSMIRGSVATDLKPGAYKVAADTKAQRWVFEGGVNTGLRFVVDLEGADPWTLSYPAKVDVVVGSGATGGTGPIDLVDLLRLQDQMAALPDAPAPAPDTDPDHFDAATYDLDYRSEGGSLSKFLKVSYANGSVVDVALDNVTTAMPRLFAVKTDALKIMGEYNLLFIMGAFGTVFFILTIDPFVAGMPSVAPRYKVTRRRMIKTKSTAGKSEGTPEGKAPAETGAPPAVKGGVEEPAVPAAGVQPKVTPVNGKINVGGGLEKGSAEATNLNPINPNSGGPSRGIPNHVKAGFEDIGDVFEAGSAKSIFSNRLRFGDVTDWPKAAAGSARVMAPGGRLALNVWTSSAEEAQSLVSAFTSAGFKDVKAIGSGTGTMIFGVR